MVYMYDVFIVGRGYMERGKHWNNVYNFEKFTLKSFFLMVGSVFFLRFSFSVVWIWQRDSSTGFSLVLLYCFKFIHIKTYTVWSVQKWVRTFSDILCITRERAQSEFSREIAFRDSNEDLHKRVCRFLRQKSHQLIKSIAINE